MTSAKSPNPKDSPPEKSRDKWSLTQQAFEKLLVVFSSDPGDAAKLYESLRTKLTRFFESRPRAALLATDHVDEVFNRIARRIDEGKEVNNVVPYAFRVAYLVYLEILTEPDFVEIEPDTAKAPASEPQFEDTETEQRQRCFDSCLAALPNDNRQIILVYYQEQRRAKIERRKSLAEQLKISLEGLRTRAFRIRKGLEECVMTCLQQPVQPEM
ncbi:MAG TPA: sigma-70 family RNA polymerase sigma factor [Pyrinomonadaceae bacterium]